MLAAEATSDWYDVSWVDWLSVLGLVLALLGIYMAYAQAKKATSAADAARQAVEQTQRQLRANQLLVLVPQLRWISNELETSIVDDDKVLAGRTFHNWRWAAGHVHGILTAANPDEKKLIQALQASVGLAFAATTSLLDPASEGQSVLQSCKKARDAIGTVCNQLTSWVGQAATSENIGVTE